MHIIGGMRKIIIVRKCPYGKSGAFVKKLMLKAGCGANGGSQKA